MGKGLDFGFEAPRINLLSVLPGRESSIKPSGGLIISSTFEGSLPTDVLWGHERTPKDDCGEASLRGKLKREGVNYLRVLFNLAKMIVSILHF